ncbi:hemoglobin subunit beta-like [Scyliorhinus canicula]|uniref:hemoglobin subunit beta-like n=1 Tax=Scyliorhinus canicula TaxID=7830 RepID=UPI0018F5D118|nr:hemoglobin subunit beta-like [Scyliorhinus canicula]
MVHWTQEEKNEITHTWGALNCTAIGTRALERMFCVYPWTTRYFSKIPAFTAEGHAIKVVGALDKAVKHLDNVKAEFNDLSKKHAEELHIDSGSFHLLTDCFIVELAHVETDKFSPHIHATWDKFFKVVVDAISKHYH